MLGAAVPALTVVVVSGPAGTPCCEGAWLLT